MKTLILGASGATGKHLVEILLSQNLPLKIIVRRNSQIPEHWTAQKNLEIIVNQISEMSIQELATHIKDCNSVASCLGHNLSLKGMYGHPRKLVRDSIENVSKAIQFNSAKNKVKLVLMNTAGNSNRDLSEQLTKWEVILLSIIRKLLPPHLDNELASDYLREQLGQHHPLTEWCVVRPDSLIDEADVSPYQVFASPIRSALFNPGKTSRINVGHFMAELIMTDQLWNQWKGQMPVIYNSSSLNS